MADEVVGIRLKITAPDAQGTAKDLANVELQLQDINDELKLLKKQASGKYFDRLIKEQDKLTKQSKNVSDRLEEIGKKIKAVDQEADGKTYDRLVNEQQKLIQQSDALEASLLDVNKAIDQAKRAASGEAYAELREEQLKLRAEGVRLRQEIKSQERAFRDAEFPEDSIIGLRKRYRELKREIDGLSSADPKFDELANEAGRLSQRINDLNKQAGSFKDNIGRYEESITSALDATGSFFSGGGVSGLLGGVAGGFLGGAFLQVADLAIQAGQAIAEEVEEIRSLERQVRQLNRSISEVGGRAIVARARAIGKTFDKEVNEVLKNADKLTKDFGISFDEAFGLIETGLIAGADLQGEFFDSLREYPALFAEIGGNADQFVSILTQAEIQGVFGDKAIDAVKEFGLSVREMTTATEDAFTALGISQEQIAQDIEEGGIIKVLETTQMRMNEFADDSPVIGQALADIFRGAGEDTGVRFLRTVDLSDDALQNLIDTTDGYVQRQLRVLKANQDLTEAQGQLNAALGNSGKGIETLGTRLQTFGTQVLTAVVQRFTVLKNVILTIFGAEDLPTTIWEVIAEDAIAAAEAQEEVGKERKVQEDQEKQRHAAALRRKKEREAAEKRAREGEIGSISEMNARLDELEEKLSKTADLEKKIQLSLEIENLEEEIAVQEAHLQRALDDREGLTVPLGNINPAQTELAGQIAAEVFIKGAVAGIDEDESLPTAIFNSFNQALGLEQAAREENAREEEEFIAQMRERANENFRKQLEEEDKQREARLEKQRAFEEQRIGIMTDAFSQAGKLLGNFLTEGEEGFEDFFKGFVLTILSAIEKTILLYAAATLAREVSEKSFGGIITAALLNGIVSGFFAGIKAQVRNLYEGGVVLPVSNEGFASVGAELATGQKITSNERNRIQPTTTGGDNVLIRAKVGEMVLNKGQQQRIERATSGNIWRDIGVRGASGSSRRENKKDRSSPSILVRAKTGEIILNQPQQEAAQMIGGKNIFKIAKVPGFANGGVIGSPGIQNGTPQILNPNVTVGAQSLIVNSSIDEESVEMIATAIAERTASSVSEQMLEATIRSERIRALNQSLSK